MMVQREQPRDGEIGIGAGERRAVVMVADVDIAEGGVELFNEYSEHV